MMRYGIFLFWVFLCLPVSLLAAEPAASPAPVDDLFFRAAVTDVLSAGEAHDGFEPVFRQEIRVRFLHGPDAGHTATVTYETRPDAEQHRLRAGDTVLVGVQILPEAPPFFYVSDVYRLPSLVWLLVFFLIAAVVTAGRRGALAFVGIPLNLAVILFFILPQITAGRNPLVVCIVGTVGMAVISFYLGHGFRTQTTIAFVSTLCMIIVTVLLAAFFSGWTRLFGLGTEAAFYLQFAPISLASFRGLLIGGIVIGALGVLDDVTTAQAAAVEAIHAANPALSFSELYLRSMTIGKEHIASVINTLVLAYTGASLPLLLLFHVYEQPAWVTLNSELLMEEIVRTLAGSIALIFAVPLTSVLSAFVLTRRQAKSRPDNGQTP